MTPPTASPPTGARPSATRQGVRFVDIAWDARHVRIEHEWIDAEQADLPLLVFLHEGLGSLSMWRDFPQQLCAACHCRGLVYSRPGYGASTPRAPGQAWGTDFMHRQALEVLPALLDALGVDTLRQAPWLLGHSDGATIALLYAAHFPTRLAGAVLLAPHILVEELSITSIEQARKAYRETDLRERLARHHDDPDSAFWGWNKVWLDPAFRDWSIHSEIRSIACPLLAVQGLEDEYGTLEQIRGIKRAVPHTQLLELPACGHSPQRDQPERLITAAADFMHRHPLRCKPKV
ncbi:MAG: alpha/beta fold hydrolase [Betaproteobacteria bacterium]